MPEEFDPLEQKGEGNAYDPLFAERTKYLLSTPQCRFVGGVLVCGLFMVLGCGVDRFFKGLAPPPKPAPSSFEESRRLLEAFKPIAVEPGAGKIPAGLQILERRLKNNPPTDPKERQELEQRIQALREREAGPKEPAEPKKE